MDTNTNALYTDPAQQVSNPILFNENIIQIADPLAIEVEDSELIKIVNTRIKASKKFYEEKYNLSARRKKNETYLFGRQIADKEKEGKLKDYETRSSDNALYEIEASLKPLAMSKLPDIIVTPGSDDPGKKDSAKELSIAIDDMNKSREQRSVLGLGFKHQPVYFTAVIKARWDSAKSKQGEETFEVVHPDYIVADHTSTTKNPDDMSFIAQCVPMTVQEMLMKFPSKKQKIYEEMQLKGIMAGSDPTWTELASEVKVWEVWFTWFRKKGDKTLVSKPEDSIFEPGVEWEEITGVLWKFNDLLLDKMLDPNHDWEGEDAYFIYGTPGDESTKQQIDPKQIVTAYLSGVPMPNFSKEKIYHNYFNRSHKPFYFFGYDQWGKIPYDETSRIEQNIRNQENLDDQNKTILDQIKTRVKHIWGGESGLRSGDIQRIDMDDPKMDVRVEGDPNKVHKAIDPERPDAAQFNALGDTRSRMYAISGASAVRGQIQSDTATTNQIAREADFTRADDLVEETINAASEWIAGWRMQFIKLRYTEDHLRQVLGAKGAITYIKLRRDMISDGMEVMVKASSTDKLKAQRNAMDTAKLGAPYSNPLDFFADMGMSEPEGRTERGMMFATDPQGYIVKYVMGLDNTAQMAGALNGPGASIPPSPPLMSGAPPASLNGQAPQGPTPTDTTQIAATPPSAPQGSPRML